MAADASYMQNQRPLGNPGAIIRTSPLVMDANHTAINVCVEQEVTEANTCLEHFAALYSQDNPSIDEGPSKGDSYVEMLFEEDGVLKAIWDS
ncbi:hypothetical protein NDU88_007387 [Pleurodeles waltl]|uniref:Uncharacterized protein n=1 Tax=Pleurodeles waltl TaxID=8319 RepID=A0AAV7RQU9_PLEWA|nr:hypothetical protein NDU88_007387 [Pleurodeles waltl]